MNETKEKQSFLASSIVIGASMIIVALIVGYVIDYVKTYDNAVITVTGVATKQVKSDAVKWQSELSAQTGPSAADLQKGSLDMQNDLSAVLAYFTSNGVATSDITIDPLSIDPLYQTPNGIQSGKFGYIGGTLSNYALTQDIHIESGNVDDVTKLAQDAPQYFAGKGIVFSTNNPEYYLKTDTLDALRSQMLGSALADAKSRAQVITEGVGARVGNLRSSSVGVTQITPVNSTEASDAGAYDTTSVEKLLTYLVHTTFTLK
ncbi:MAG: SIMPL domain-containing protein [Candidatus Pacebacteria bacterium]|nr:SIMPL domain-containing protein [Candidatus Paceibacterota bacterium]